jgi:hypothetical protein
MYACNIPAFTVTIGCHCVELSWSLFVEFVGPLSALLALCGATSFLTARCNERLDLLTEHLINRLLARDFASAV